MSVTDIIREVLNENISEVRRLSAHLKNSSTNTNEVINTVSDCGETALHIAVFKWNRRMVKIFLEAGADPNCLDIHTESPVHVAAKLGLHDILSDLYYSGRCDLSIKTASGLTALDICSMEFNPDDDLATMRSFKNWDRDRSDDTDIVRQGRLKCVEFLKEKTNFDYHNKLDRITRESTSWMVEQSKLRHILAEPDFQHSYQTTVERIEYPETSGVPTISENDQEMFEKFRIGVHNTSEALFIHQMVQQASTVGLARASSNLIIHRKDS